VITIAFIKATVAAHYGLSEQQLIMPCNCRRIARPRQLGMAFARDLTGRSRTVIGRHFGNKHESTVLHAERSIARRLFVEPELREAAESVLATLLDSGSPWKDER
jgi:chromosomal replication initiator protein